MARLMQTVRHGVLVGVFDGGNLEAALQRGNHSSTLQHSDCCLINTWRVL